MNKNYDEAQKWWEESRRILQESIEKTIETSSEKETLSTMLDLVNRMKIRSKSEG